MELDVKWFYVGRYDSYDQQYNQLSVPLSLEKAREFKERHEKEEPARYAIIAVMEEHFTKEK